MPNSKGKISIILTSGASCPDTLVDKVLEKFAPLNSNLSSILLRHLPSLFDLSPKAPRKMITNVMAF